MKLLQINELDPSIKMVIDRYADAFNRNSAPEMNDLFSDDMTFVNFNGNLVTNRQDLLAAQTYVFAESGPLHDIDASYEIERAVQIANDVVNIHTRQRCRDQSSQDILPARLTVLVHLQGSEWKIVFAQNTPLS